MYTFFKASMFGLALLATTVFSGQVFAQTETTATDTVLPSSAVLVSNVNIYEANVVSQENNKVLIGFDIKNEGGTVNGDMVESGLKYGIKVMDGKTTNEYGVTFYGATVDERVFSEVFSLNTGEKVHKEIVYTAPRSFKGEYYFQVYGVKEGGMPYAVAYIDEPVVFEASADALSVNITDCAMVVGSETQEYTLEFGVDVASSEELSLKCTLEASGQLGNYTPQVTIYERALSGDMVSDVKLETGTIESEKTDSILFTIPVPTEPQAYDAKLILLSGSDEEAEIISNTVVAHFVVQGDSATIQDVQIDKDYYKAGEQAEVVLNISGNAGLFTGSRASQANTPATGDSSYWYRVSILSEGAVCGDSGEPKEFVFNEYGSQVIPVTITADCVNPTTKIILSSKDGTVYDEQDFAVETKTIPTEEVVPEVPVENNATTTVLILALLLVLVAVAFFIYKKTKETPSDTTPPASNIVGILVAVFLSSMFFGASTAEAAVYYIRTSDIDVAGVSTPQYSVLILNNSKEFYAPTDTEITVNYSGTVKSCGNFLLGFALFGGHVAYTANYGTPIFETGGIVSTTDTSVDFTGATFTRPMTTKNPGTGNVIPLTGANYIIHEGDGTGVCDGSHGCTNVCNNQCDKNTNWNAQSTGYDENTCTCYNVETFGHKEPTNIDHPYGIATPVDFTLSTSPVTGCAGGASTNVSIGSVVGANTFEIDCGAGFVAGQTATCNLVSAGSHTITARASRDSEPWVTKTATVVVSDCTTTVNGICGPLSGRVGDWDTLKATYPACEQGTYKLTSTDKEPMLGFYEWSCEGLNTGRTASCWLEQRMTTEPLLKFSKLPSQAVEVGDSVFFTWKTQNVTTCTASGGGTTDWAGEKAVSGTQEVVMTGSGWPHFYLQCWNSEGVATQKADIGFQVLSSTYTTTDGISSLESVPSTINFGESSTVVWTTVGDVDHCSILGGKEWQIWTDVPINGSGIVSPRETTGYLLKCYNAAGDALKEHITSVVVENLPESSANVATCPYVPTFGSTIVNFNSGLSRDTDITVRTLHSKLTSFYQGVPTIPAGTYDVETVSYDGYVSRVSSSWQPDEEWFVEFSPYAVPNAWPNAKTGVTTDIADFVEENHRTDSFAGIVFTKDINSVLVRHKVGSEGQSVVPVCMKISPANSAPMLTLKADPVEIDVALNNKATLTWVPTNADKCIATGGAGDGSDGWTGEMDATGGSLQVQPTNVKTMYYMECWDSANYSTGLRSAMVEVKGGTTAPGLEFIATPPTVALPGDASNLQWTPTNVVSCEATGGDVDGWPGPRPKEGGVYEVKPLVTTAYTLECVDGTGVSVLKTAIVTVGSAPSGDPEVTLEINDVPYRVGNEIVWTATPVFGKGTPPYTFTWLDDFLGETGTPIGGGQEIIKKTFATPQTVDVEVRITDSLGNTGEASRSINVKNNVKPQ